MTTEKRELEGEATLTLSWSMSVDVSDEFETVGEIREYMVSAAMEFMDDNFIDEMTRIVFTGKNETNDTIRWCFTHDHRYDGDASCAAFAGECDTDCEVESLLTRAEWEASIAALGINIEEDS